MKDDYKNLGRATLCSLTFFGLFVSFNSASNVETLLIEEDGFGKLGFIALSLYYLSVAFSSLFATNILKRFGEIKCMAIGSLFNTPWILSFILISYYRIQ
jgi:hypothetical protein